ncbi:MAG TPA: DUF1801 domain-containing protein [Bacteroidia bacterium]|nr:DUF1801 domain-containing protein [Bacteroidia bacterium]
MNQTKFKTVDEYLDTFPKDARELLLQMRIAIRQAAPQAEEVISYNMPAYKFHGVLVYFAGYKKHIGFYPSTSPIRIFKNELAKYKTSKGTIQFPIEDGIPVTLVKKIVKFRIQENLERQKQKAKKK